MESFVYMRFLPFSNLLSTSIKVSLCALEVGPPECEDIEKWIFSARKRFP